MSVATETSGWILDLQREVRRGRHVILHGNIRDHALFRGNLVTLSGALSRALSELQFSFVAHYIPGQGLHFDTPDARTAWEASERGAAPAPARPAGPMQAPPIPAPNRPASTAGPIPQTPTQVASAMRRVLAANSGSPVAIALHFSDKLFAGGENQPIDERMQMVELSSAMANAHQHASPACAGMRNSVIFVASAIGQIPPWLYRDNPLVAVVPVARPTAREREACFRYQYPSFFGAQPGGPGAELAAQFGAITDGLAFGDLGALRLTGHSEGIPVADLRRLVERFKHGRIEDPWQTLRFVETEARKKLAESVIGQPRAVDSAVNVLVSAKGGIGMDPPGQSRRPKGVLFFVGPTGVGKTELAKAVTDLVFCDKEAFARFDMSEYQQEHSSERLTGAPPSYIGYEAGGQLTNRMKTKPFSVLLFDEVEKAHPRVLDKLLQVIDDGRLTDGMGETVQFDKSLIVFTSNVGSTTKETVGGIDRDVAAVEPDMAEEALVQHYRAAVRDHFTKIARPELLGRIGEENIVVFGFIQPDDVAPILHKFLADVSRSALEQGQLSVIWDNTITALVVEYMRSPEARRLGARSMRNFVQSTILPELNRAAAAGPGTITVAADGGAIYAVRSQ